MAYALITCLDSTFDIPSLMDKSKHLTDLKDNCTGIGKGVILTTRQLIVAERRQRMFFGFDEVWFFSHSDITPKPDDLILVGPSRPTAEQIDKHAEWLVTNHCSLGLGDGTGMNFCLRVRGPARYIMNAFHGAGIEASTPSVVR